MAIKAITFDLDNTLIDFMKMKRKASNAAARAMVRTGLKMGIRAAEQELFTIYFKNIEGKVAFEEFLNKHDALTAERLDAAIIDYNKTKLKYMKPYPKVKATLLALRKKGLRLAIITDAPKANALKRLEALKIKECFDAIVCHDDTGHKKPSEMPFRRALELLKLKASEVMHVGDWPERDVAGARAVGMKTCLAKYGWLFGKYQKADYEIDGIEELIKIVF
jgi:2-haloalkanoic acid dehalogenase type II